MRSVFYKLGLADAYLGTSNGLAGKLALLYLLEADNTSLSGVNSVVTADERTRAGNLRATSLAYEYFACAHFLATKALNAKACTGVVMDVLT